MPTGNGYSKANNESELLTELLEHYEVGKQDMETRKERDNGWDDILREYHGYLPENWPYYSEIHDPVLRTKVLEKNARLFNNKLKGKLIPREGGDATKARIHNAILDYQWDSADTGGSMLEKWALMDIQTRLFGASFGLVYWKTSDTYEGNEFKVLDNRDVFVDPAADHVKNANWIQVREYLTIGQLEERNQRAGTKIYKNLNELKDLIDENYQGDRRDVNYTSVQKEVKELEDRTGTDKVFPLFEIVTEYRNDHWYAFAPRHSVLIMDTKSPAKHKRIPVVQLRYYPVGDDIYGDSEVEPVLSMCRFLNAQHSAFTDAINLSMNPPIKVANNFEVRMDTLVYGPNAIWLVGSNPNNVAEHRTGDQAIGSYRTAIPAIKSAIDVALGETSQGTSNLDFREADKTATEVMDLARQRQSRDQQNQLYLSESLKDMMMLWVSNNQQFYFSDPSQQYKVVRIVGKEMIESLKELGLDAMEPADEAVEQIAGLIAQTGGQVSDTQMQNLLRDTSMPANPVLLNPDEKDPSKYQIKPKLEMDPTGDFASLYLTEQDMPGDMRLDYIPDVKSMAVGAGAEKAQNQVRMLEMMLNPRIDEKLAMEKKTLKVSELLLDIFRGDGQINPEKYIGEYDQEAQIRQQQLAAQAGSGGGGGLPTGPLTGGIGTAQGMEQGGNPAGIFGSGVISQS